MYKDILLQKNKDQPRKGHFCVLLVKKIEKHSHLIVRNRKKSKEKATSIFIHQCVPFDL